MIREGEGAMVQASSMSPFMLWLVRQMERDDAVGDIARDLLDDPYAPRDGTSIADYRDYLVALGASVPAITALEQAWQEWTFVADGGRLG